MSTRAVTVTQGHELELAGDLLADFGEFLRLRVADGDASPETVRSYRGQVGQFVSWCQGRGITPARANEQDLAHYRRHLVEHGYTRGTVAVKLAAVRRFYEAATWRGLRADNPAAGLKAPRERTTRAERVKYLPLAGMGRLLDLPQKARDRAILYLLAGHGLRVSEVARLELADVDLDAGTLRVTGKGDKTRTVYLTEQSGHILRAWLAERNPSPGQAALFVTGDHRTRGHGMTARAVRAIVDGYLLQAGLKAPGISCHSLRHSFATWALAGGVVVGGGLG